MIAKIMAAKTRFNRINKKFVGVALALTISFIIRIYLSQLEGNNGDIILFKLWSREVYLNGTLNFYSGVRSDYPPFYIYILWIVGAFYKLFFSFSFDIDAPLFTILIKAPANLADVIIAFLIFLIIKKYAEFKVAYISMIFYAFNPAIIYNSAIWGQVDSVYTLFILFALKQLASGKLELAGAFMAVAILTKPQSLVIFPFIAILVIKNQRPSRLAKIFVITAFVFIALSLPFNIEPLQLIKLYTSGYGHYAFNSVNAFNFWALSGLYKPDDTILLFFSYRIWGYILFGSLFIYVAYLAYFTKKNDDDRLIYFASAVLFFGFFMFFTRVHERYLFPMFALFVIAATLNRRLTYVFWIMTLTFLFNLHFVMQNLNNNQYIQDGNPFVLLNSGINLSIFACTLYYLSKSSGVNTSKMIEVLLKDDKLIVSRIKIKRVYVVVVLIMSVLAVATFGSDFFLTAQKPPHEKGLPSVSIGCDRVLWKDATIELTASTRNIDMPRFNWSVNGKDVGRGQRLKQEFDTGEHRVVLNVSFDSETLTVNQTTIVIDSVQGISLRDFEVSNNQWGFQTTYKGKDTGVKDVMISVDSSPPSEVNDCGFFSTKSLLAGDHFWNATYHGENIVSGFFEIKEVNEVKISRIDVAPSYNAGDTVISRIFIKNTGSTTITGFDIKALVINNNFEWMGDKAKREYFGHFPSDLKPGDVYEVPIAVMIPEEVSGIRPAGRYSISVSLLFNGQTTDTKMMSTEVK